MYRPKIAVDVDDVLADSTESLRRLVNKKYNANLQREHYMVPGEYWGYYERVWQANGLGGTVVFEEVEQGMEIDQSHVAPHNNSSDVLQKLATSYDLVIITARNPKWEDATHTWLNQHFPEVFSQVIFCGRPDSVDYKTKGDLCSELGAEWLIDDSVLHCKSAIDKGVQPVLFGEYGWHADIPDKVIRCRDWQAVMEHFDARNA